MLESGNFSRGCQHLVGFGANANVLGEVLPANDARLVYQKFCGARYVVSVGTTGVVYQIVPSDDIKLGVREKRKGVSNLIPQLCRFFGWINADGDWLHTGCLKLFKIFLNAS